MEWPHLIIALIVILAYVIKHIYSVQQEAAAQREREKLRSAPQPVVEVKTDEQTASERTALDRRIEEATERRREQETGAEEKPAAPRRQIPMSVPMTATTPVPRYQPPPPPDEWSQPPMPRPPRSELPRVVRLAPRKKPPIVQLAIPAIVPPQPPVPVAIDRPPAVATVVSAQAVSPAAREVLDLLRNRRTLAAAYVLHEILARPVSQRRRRV